jgi:hypothetical protein
VVISLGIGGERDEPRPGKRMDKFVEGDTGEGGVETGPTGDTVNVEGQIPVFETHVVTPGERSLLLNQTVDGESPVVDLGRRSPLAHDRKPLGLDLAGREGGWHIVTAGERAYRYCGRAGIRVGYPRVSIRITG